MPEPIDLDDLERLARAATPGPWEWRFANEQGGLHSVWGRQGTPPDFADGWAIPFVAQGVQSNMEWVAAVSPDRILALIAENRRLREALRHAEQPKDGREALR